MEQVYIEGKTFDKIDLKNRPLSRGEYENCRFLNCDFSNGDLSRATFDNTVIEKADFRTSYNYSIDPEMNRIKKAKFSVHGISGLLEKYDLFIEDIL